MLSFMFLSATGIMTYLKMEHMRFSRITFTIIGIWPVRLQGFKLLLYNAYFCLLIWYFALFVLTQFIESQQSFKANPKYSCIGLGLAMLYLLVVYTIHICRSKKVRKYIEMIYLLEEALYKENLEIVSLIHEKYAKLGYLFSFLMLFFPVTGYIAYVVNPIINTQKKISENPSESIEKEFIFSSWVPFDRNLYYWGTIAIQASNGIIGVSYFTSSNIFLVTILLFALSCIKILQLKFKYFKCFSNKISKQRQISFKEASLIYLKQCIKEHQSLIELVNGLRVTFQVIFLINFLSAAYQIAVLGLQLLMVTNVNWALLGSLCHIISIFSVLYMTYFTANEIISESTNIVDAIFQCDWSDLDLHIQKSLLLVMLRCQKPLYISAGPFYKLELSLLVKILKAVYSIFCVMYKKI